jgi:hypothetical protein
VSLKITEIHRSSDAKSLNTEWFVLRNDGEKPFSTKNCTLSVTRKGSKKKRELGTIDPGFTLAPGEKARIVTGTPGRKAQGKPPEDELTNYHLFLGAPVLKGKGTVLVFALRSHELVSEEFDPDAPQGIAASDSDG